MSEEKQVDVDPNNENAARLAELDQLEAAYREAYDAFANSRSDEDKERYKEAKQAFADARKRQRQVEEEDPDHPRGNVFVAVNNDPEGEE